MTHETGVLRSWRVLALVLGLLQAGCFSATASIPEIEVTRENLTFQGVPEDMPTEVTENIPAEVRERYGLPAPGEDYHFPTLTFSYARVPVDMPTGLTSKMHIREVTIRAHEGSPNLTFIHGLKLTTTQVGELPGEERVLLQYPAPGTSVTTPLERELTLPVLTVLDALDPWKADNSIYTLDIWADLAQLPRQNWAIDIVLGLNGSVEFTF